MLVLLLVFTLSEAAEVYITESGSVSSSSSNNNVKLQHHFVMLNGGSSFFEPAQVGWENQCRELGLRCDYYQVASAEGVGCTEFQKQMLTGYWNGTHDKVDGIAMAPCHGYELAPYFQRVVQEAGIPVVLFDTDSHNSSRAAYVGTDNYFMGITMANVLKQLRPEGGTFGIFTSGGKPNLEARVQGFVNELTRDNHKDGKAHWEQIPESPLDGIGRDILAGQVLTEFNPTALAVMYQSPMRSENWTDFVDANRGITIVASDSSTRQLDFLNRDYVDGLVGQLPYDMGAVSAKVLYEYVTTGGKLQKEVYGTNLVSYTLIPLDLPPLNLDQNLLGDLQYVGYVCFGVVVLTSMVCMGWTVRRRNAMVVRAAQPFFLCLVAGGVLILSSAMVPLSFDDNGIEMDESRGQAICMSIPWLSFTGFSTIFAALFSKTWRVNRLFQNRQSHARVIVSEKDVLVPFMMLMTCNTTVLVCWTVLDPLSYVRQEHDGTDYWNRVISTYGACRSNHVYGYLIPLAALNLSVVAVASFQAYRARNIENEFSESKYIGMAISFLFQGFVTGIPVVVVVRDMPQSFYVVLTLMIFLLSMAILLVIFVPKVYNDHKYSNLSPRQQKQLMAESVRRSSINSSRRLGSNDKISNDNISNDNGKPRVAGLQMISIYWTPL